MKPRTVREGLVFSGGKDRKAGAAKQKNANAVRQGRKGSDAQVQKHRTHGGLAREIAYLCQRSTYR